MSPARVRNAEWLAALGAIALLLSLFLLHWTVRGSGLAGWFSYPPEPRRIFTYPSHPGASLARTGWQALPVLRWFLLVAAVLALLAVLAQARRGGPALPSTLELLGMLLAALATLLLLIRLASIGTPLRFGAVAGMLAVVAVTGGLFRGLRTEQGGPADEGPVEVVELPADLH